MLKCRECRKCNGIACAGEIPGLGGKDSGRSFIRNVEMMNRVKIQMDVLCDDGVVDPSVRILGMDLAIPVMIAPIAGIQNNYGADLSDQDYVVSTIEAAQQTGIRAFTGDGIHMEPMFIDPARAISEHGGKGIVTMKPWVKEGIDARIAGLQGLQFEALAMDVDAAGLPLLREGKTPVENKNCEKLAYIRESLNKPFIVKGVMTVHAALEAKKAGASAIVVSNHGGRVMDDCLATIEVVSEIRRAVGNDMVILLDGGIRSGMDVFKAIALGADAVLVGRPFALSVVKGGTEGLVRTIETYRDQLIQTMRMTGCHSLSDITEEKVSVRF
ncbi:MAG: alpha-hydroxy-acid oxidizing protein [Bulleidia sp.]